MKKLSLLTMCCSALFFLQCKQAGPDEAMLKAEENNIRQTDMEWSQSAKNLDDYMAYFLDDAKVMESNQPIATGKEAIKTMFSPMYDLPGFSITFEPILVEVANSGDFAYSIGTYKLTVNDSTGMPMVDNGKYLTIWKKQADGSWKVAADMSNSDLPAQ